MHLTSINPGAVNQFYLVHPSVPQATHPLPTLPIPFEQLYGQVLSHARTITSYELEHPPLQIQLQALILCVKTYLTRNGVPNPEVYLVGSTAAQAIGGPQSLHWHLWINSKPGIDLSFIQDFCTDFLHATYQQWNPQYTNWILPIDKIYASKFESLGSGWRCQIGSAVTLDFVDCATRPVSVSALEGWIVSTSEQGCVAWCEPPRGTGPNPLMYDLQLVQRREFVGNPAVPGHFMSLLNALNAGALVSHTEWMAAQEQVRLIPKEELKKLWVSAQSHNTTLCAHWIALLNFLLLVQDQPELCRKVVKMKRRAYPQNVEARGLLKLIVKQPELTPHLLGFLYGAFLYSWMHPEQRISLRAWNFDFCHEAQPRACVEFPCEVGPRYLWLASPNKFGTPGNLVEGFVNSVDALEASGFNFNRFEPLLTILGFASIRTVSPQEMAKVFQAQWTQPRLQQLLNVAFPYDSLKVTPPFLGPWMSAHEQRLVARQDQKNRRPAAVVVLPPVNKSQQPKANAQAVATVAQVVLTDVKVPQPATPTAVQEKEDPTIVPKLESKPAETPKLEPAKPAVQEVEQAKPTVQEIEQAKPAITNRNADTPNAALKTADNRVTKVATNAALLPVSAKKPNEQKIAPAAKPSAAVAQPPKKPAPIPKPKMEEWTLVGTSQSETSLAAKFVAASARLATQIETTVDRVSAPIVNQQAEDAEPEAVSENLVHAEPSHAAKTSVLAKVKSKKAKLKPTEAEIAKVTTQTLSTTSLEPAVNLEKQQAIQQVNAWSASATTVDPLATAEFKRLIDEWPTIKEVAQLANSVIPARLAYMSLLAQVPMDVGALEAINYFGQALSMALENKESLSKGLIDAIMRRMILLAPAEYPWPESLFNKTNDFFPYLEGRLRSYKKGVARAHLDNFMTCWLALSNDKIQKLVLALTTRDRSTLLDLLPPDDRATVFIYAFNAMFTRDADVQTAIYYSEAAKHRLAERQYDQYCQVVNKKLKEVVAKGVELKNSFDEQYLADINDALATMTHWLPFYVKQAPIDAKKLTRLLILTAVKTQNERIQPAIDELTKTAAENGIKMAVVEHKLNVTEMAKQISASYLMADQPLELATLNDILRLTDFSDVNRVEEAFIAHSQYLLRLFFFASHGTGPSGSYDMQPLSRFIATQWKTLVDHCVHAKQFAVSMRQIRLTCLKLLYLPLCHQVRNSIAALKQTVNDDEFADRLSKNLLELSPAFGTHLVKTDQEAVLTFAIETFGPKHTQRVHEAMASNDLMAEIVSPFLSLLKLQAAAGMTLNSYHKVASTSETSQLIAQEMCVMQVYMAVVSEIWTKFIPLQALKAMPMLISIMTEEMKS